MLDRVDAARFTAPLAGALATLKQRDRDVVLLIALGGLSHAEVASDSAAHRVNGSAELLGEVHTADLRTERAPCLRSR
ncbi:sigma factor-like helix-turn-helix DNA-binding protein [Nonomuraea sp. NPDC049750]|uniref:sigma factor-like helix-turn-helix DNA-binding protein n=1 Tax=Nonomuraea sp. NPDC049750 TaxID=3154738 RepID=UPI0033F4A311